MSALPSYFLVSECDGHLYDTRKPDWPNNPVRRDYAKTFKRIETVSQLKAVLRAGGHAWPGGYPIALLTAAGEMVKPEALIKDRNALREAYSDIENNSEWRIVGADVYWEGPPVECAYTGEMIESAYGEPDENNRECSEC